MFADEVPPCRDDSGARLITHLCILPQHDAPVSGLVESDSSLISPPCILPHSGELGVAGRHAEPACAEQRFEGDWTRLLNGFTLSFSSQAGLALQVNRRSEGLIADVCLSPPLTRSLYLSLSLSLSSSLSRLLSLPLSLSLSLSISLSLALSP